LKVGDLFTAAFHEHRTTENERGDIRADLSADLGECRTRESEFPEIVERNEDSRGIRRATAETAACGDPLRHANARAGVGTARRTRQDARGLEAEVVRITGIGREFLRRLDVDRVEKRNRHHDRTERMVAVRTLGEDLQREIDLGGSGERHARRSRTAEWTFAKSFASFAVGIVENARRMSPERTIVPVEYFAIRCLRTCSASTPRGFTHMK